MTMENNPETVMQPEEGAEAREVAEPAEGAAEGAEAREPAVPAEGEQDPATRRRNADERRKREREAEERAAQVRIDKAYADAFGPGVSPYTGKPVDGEKAFREHMAAKEADDARKAAEQRDAKLKKAGIDPTAIKELVAEHPDVKAAREATAAAQAAQQQASQEAAKKRLEAGLQKIQAMDPDVKTLEDIGKMETREKFAQLFSRGYEIEDAFYIANQKAVDERRAAAIRQKVLNQQGGKEHLPGVESSGGNDLVVPESYKRSMTAMGYNMTAAELKKSYAEYQKSIVDD